MAVGDGVSAIAQLAMTFGGFSPTAMDGVEATREHIARVQEAQARRQESERRRREIERARASSPKQFSDEHGATWTYVVMDGSFIRIEGCKRPQRILQIPAEIEGLPVRALGSDIFNESEVVEEITCPDSVEAIGSCAFRLTTNLKKVTFPKNVADFSASWLQHCSSLEEMTLPGMLDEITPAIFDNPSLHVLHIGPLVSSVKPGACERTHLEQVTVDDNPFLKTDGDALYTADGQEMIALVRPVRQYRVADGCVRMAKKCCMGIGSLSSVELPDSLEEIGDFAFAHTGLATAEVPGTVRRVGTRAFYHCTALRQVTLHEGLREVGEAAFADSGLRSIMLPASIERLGNSITEGSAVVHSGPDCSFQIDPASKTLSFDGEGGLYRQQEDGLHFIQLVDRAAHEYSVAEGTTYIDEYAFAFHEAIESVVLPRGVREIRKNAFRVCRSLKHVSLPETLEVIGKEAFLDTSLEEVRLPAGFRDLSDDAFITAGAHRLSDPPSLRVITVDPRNERFYVQGGLLCRRGEGGDRGIVFNDDEPNVTIPENVTTIAPFAFSNARNIRTFTVGPNVKTIGTSGFSTWCAIEHIHVELAEPVEGRTVFDVRFPDTPRSAHEIAISLGGSSWVNVPDIMLHYDNCIAHAHDYNARESDGVSAYEQARMMMDRLKDPIMLTPFNRSVFERTLREHLVEICMDIARHDDRELVNDLCDLGFLNADTIEGVTVEVGKLQDAAMSGYLLELKRRRFGRAVLDFDL